MTDRLKPCPICNRQPKFHAYQLCCVWYSCKGGIFKRHKKLETEIKFMASPSDALQFAEQKWNELAKELEKE